MHNDSGGWNTGAPEKLGTRCQLGVYEARSESEKPEQDYVKGTSRTCTKVCFGLVNESRIISEKYPKKDICIDHGR